MSLNASLQRAKIEVPTKEDLGVVGAASQLPNTFGNNWNDPAFRKDHHKKQSLRAEQTGAVSKNYIPVTVKPPPVKPDVSAPSAVKLMETLERTQDAVLRGRHTEESDSAAPERFSVDDKALRFYAHFQEHIRESAAETLRLRKVSVTFFLSDETFLIQEPRVPNSGLVGGTLLKRQRVPISDEDKAKRPTPGPDHVTINDITVGDTLVVFGQRYTIHACDDFTREFLTAIGDNVAENEPAPDDMYQSEYRGKRVNGKTLSKTFETKDLSATLESLASKGKCAQHYPGETERAQRFVRDSGKVLCFSGFWNDEDAAPGGIMRTLEVRYFVEDDTILIIEKPNPVTKTDLTQKTFLSRRRLPVSGKPAKTVELTFAGRINGQREAFLGSDDRYYDAHDLYVGAELNVFGRKLTLFDCDAYTREYMAHHMGVDAGEPIDISGVFPRAPERKVVVPPPTGYGTEEDSLASCSIQLKNVKKDMRGWQEHGGETLRFELKFHNPEQPEDKMRKFLLTYYLADGEIQITEIAIRNTGFTGGRFLKKQRVEQHKGKLDYYKADDFYPGAVVKITGFTFEVVQMDDHSANYRRFAETKGRDPESLKAVTPDRLQRLISAFREYVTVRFYTNTEAFRAFDKDHDGYISLVEMKEVLKGSLITPHDEEAVALVKLFDTSDQGRVSYRDFMDAVATNGGPSTPTKAMDADATNASATASEAAKVTQRKGLLKRLFERLEGRCLNGFEMFRLLSTMPRAFRGRQTVELAALTNGSKDTVVTPVQLRRGLSEILGMNLAPAEMASILEFFFPTLPKDQYEARADNGTRYGITVAEFQAKLTQMSAIGQL
jgi:hypothetical protein